MAQRLAYLRGVPILAALPPELAFTQGDYYFVKPRSGSDANNGLTPDKALKTLARALALAKANQNDVVFLMAESNTAANTTDYLTAALNWNKDLVHLIGIGSGVSISPRARVSNKSTAAVPTPLFTLSANGCQIRGVGFYHGQGSADPSAASICVKVTGSRNKLVDCHIAGMGHAELDDAGSASLSIDGGAENEFHGCAIGQDTVTLGAAANSVILFANGATRNSFFKCRILLYTNHATNCVFVRAAAGSMDRYQNFEDCYFLNAVDSGSTALTYGAVIAASGSPAGGVLLLGETGIVGATDWNSTNAGNVRGVGNTVTAGSFGLGVALTQ